MTTESMEAAGIDAVAIAHARTEHARLIVEQADLPAAIAEAERALNFERLKALKARQAEIPAELALCARLTTIADTQRNVAALAAAILEDRRALPGLIAAIEEHRAAYHQAERAFLLARLGFDEAGGLVRTTQDRLWRTREQHSALSAALAQQIAAHEGRVSAVAPELESEPLITVEYHAFGTMGTPGALDE